MKRFFSLLLSLILITASAVGISASSESATAQLGTIVVFGTYEKDNNISNGAEPIEWIVLDVQGKKALLISKYGLDVHAYHTDYTYVTWETCELRSWLNGTFMNTAFSATEQSAILMTAVDNSDGQNNSKWHASGGNNTNDRLFLLSFAEAGKYMSNYPGKQSPNSVDRKCAPTDYALSRGADTFDREKTEGRDSGLWWLRSPGEDQDDAAVVLYDGELDVCSYVNSEDICVRPAFWLNLESGIF